MTTETIHFKSPYDKPLLIKSSACETYNGTTQFNEELGKKTKLWHKIIVHHHNRKYNKNQILKSLFNTVENNYFFPIAYKEGNKTDVFLVRNCFNALKNLFKKKLLIIMPDNQQIQLTVKLNVGNYEFGQINPETKIYKAIMARYNDLTNHNGVNNVLNLENFALSPELSEIEIDLGSIYIFQCLCEVISKQHDVLNSINGLNLSNNNIKYLRPMELFARAEIRMIDLRLNNVRYMTEIEHLRCITFTDLYISGNPIEQNEVALAEKLKQNFPHLIETDIKNYEKLRNVDAPSLIDSLTVEQNGKQIEVNDLLTLDRFQNNNDSWHKITIVHKGNYTKREITQAFFDFFSNRKTDIEFFPCYYNSGTTEDNFLVRNCHENLRILMENHLKLPCSKTNENLEIQLTMDVATYKRGHIDQSEVVLSSASECFHIMDRCLNLENFKSSKSLKNLTLNMGNPKTNFQILIHCGRKYFNNIVELRLNKNNISNCKGLKALDTMRNLKVLDLRDNNIKAINDLDHIPKHSIKEIRLDGNPLCGNFHSSSSYITAVKKVFPNISKLDGIFIDPNCALISRKNYLCEMKYYDLIEQFVSNYFKAYDSAPDRKDIIEMYHPKAIFTISMYYDKKNPSTQYRIMTYTLKQRNFKTINHLKNVYKNLYFGHDQIATVLSTMPKTEHDFFSLTTDTTKIKENLISITVTGLFKDIPEDQLLEPEVLLAFSRTFIISPIKTNIGVFECTAEYKIVNEHLNIFAPTTLQSRNSFKYKSLEDNSTIVANTSEEKELFIIMFEQTVGLKRVWCTRCLTDGNWNFKKSLEIFNSLMTEKQIPKIAFIENGRNVSN